MDAKEKKQNFTLMLKMALRTDDRHPFKDIQYKYNDNFEWIEVTWNDGGKAAANVTASSEMVIYQVIGKILYGDREVSGWTRDRDEADRFLQMANR